MEDDYVIEAYDQDFHTRIPRTWFKAQSKTSNILAAIQRAVDYADEGRYHSVAVWVEDVPILAIMLGDQCKVWGSDIAFAVLMEHHGLPDHFERLTEIPNRWSPNTTK